MDEISRINEDHLRIAVLLGDILDALSEGKSSQTLLPGASRLLREFDTHSNMEIEWLQECGCDYALIQGHRNGHMVMRRMLQDLVQGCFSNSEIGELVLSASAYFVNVLLADDEIFKQLAKEPF